ncbi:MAG: 4Fe-4S binding protein [Nitrospirota bacterium]|nr:4Fe-4S binding protein [Thermodesulfovibrionia bacterium]OGW64815.1 MAG: pyruvate ferredoxin oxidoreductase [Nitrospirae bacterium RIFCSPHIGHO2_02_FULL_40_19]
MKEPLWKKLTPGSVVLEAGSAVKFKTGSWRAFRPKFIEENCIHCLFCWMFCPDMSVIVKDGKMTGFDYDYCKGCGICAFECPGKKGNKAIVMEEEGK